MDAGRIGSAAERAALVADEGSLRVWDAEVVSRDPLRFQDVRPYMERLQEARERTGLGESVLTGAATVHGRPVALVAGEFGFLGGSIGVATGERIARAFERAREQRLPLIALPASGGSRMQEGTLALVQMAKLATAARSFRAEGLPYVVCLTDPTTGGVLASWGSLGTVTFALPGALLGFAGPRVVELTTGRALPDGVQRAETLLTDGLIDAIVQPADLRTAVARILAVTAPPASAPASASSAPPFAPSAPASAASEPGSAPASAAFEPGSAPSAPASAASAPGSAPPAPAPDAPRHERDAWQALRHARDPRRPGAEAVLAALGAEVTELRGDRAGRPDDPGCLTALATICGCSAMVVAQRRDADGRAPALGPAGYRKARRAFALAAELRLPVVTIVDTPGAELSAAAEHGGLAAEIAGCLAELGALPVPTLALLLGEGGSGGALAFLHADRVVCAENASLAVIAPEGASAILRRDLDHAPALAASQGGAAWELLREGIADRLVPEPLPAHEQPDAFLARLATIVAGELAALTAADPAIRLAARTARWRHLGAPLA
ncbi:carboxyl transferase domain-containing protein [Conexibacter sp. JD483]|uniref:carboxyl transferase domain-containing protein n=1 Tax=unclassified Conexibacter TaxID=2627773 RepID=UPI0027211F9B|nr:MULTISPECIES: carboxyl transferase domain-containing protein [unclassified Conexibacter]MDO8184819.1 carboxyl transferase domain-containing protein [Conexibacter sp. CPCC 205706]MDO8196594.1 carboxyl transferase domain-containing protein [Conexibacter sp. CPCC 205762]MDR9368693.1 carboxyl transferase domain-containing protein [Conexibacter sp. JD483]